MNSAPLQLMKMVYSTESLTSISRLSTDLVILGKTSTVSYAFLLKSSTTTVFSIYPTLDAIK